MRLIAIVGSARRSGNCRALADLLAVQLCTSSSDWRQQVIELAEQNITPCRSCHYECFGGSCPLREADDCVEILHSSFTADALVWFIPTYGGLPPASIIALWQRTQSEIDRIKPKKQFLAGVVLANRQGASAGEFTAQIVSSYLNAAGADQTRYIHIEPRQYLRSSRDHGLERVPDIRQIITTLAQEIVAWGRLAQRRDRS